MKDSTYIGIGVIVALVIVALIAGLTYAGVTSDIRAKGLISDCIKQGKSPVLGQYSELRSCQ